MKSNQIIRRLVSCVLMLALLLPCLGGVSAAETENTLTPLYTFTPSGKWRTDWAAINTNQEYYDGGDQSVNLKESTVTKYTLNGPVTLKTLGFIDRVVKTTNKNGTPDDTSDDFPQYFGLPFDEIKSRGSSASENLKLELVGMDPISTSAYGAVNVQFEYVYVPADATRNVAFDELLQVYVSTDGTSYLPGTVGIRWSELTGVGKTADSKDALIYTIQTENLLEISGVTDADQIQKIMIMPDGNNSRVQTGQVITTGLKINGYADKTAFEDRYPERETETISGNTLRDIVLAEANRTATEPVWTTNKAITTGYAADTYRTEINWYGPVYNRAPYAGYREQVMSYIENGAWAGEKGKATLGMDCQTFAYNAMSRVSRTNGDGISYYPGASGMKMLGELSTSDRIFFTDTDVVEKNTKDAMYAAYEQLQGGDILYRFCDTADGDVHVRLVVSVDKENDTVVCTEQGSSLNYVTSDGETHYDVGPLEYEWTSGIKSGFSAVTARKYTFSELRSNNYVPATLTVYEEGAVELADTDIIIAKTGDDYVGGVSIGMASNYPINHYDVKLTGANDQVMYEESSFTSHIRYSGYVAPDNGLNDALAELEPGNYKLSVTVHSGPFTTTTQTEVPTTTETVSFSVVGHTHTGCGYEHTEVEGKWKSLNAETSGMAGIKDIPGGKYYLEDDLELNGGHLNFYSDAVICLNGHNLIGDSENGQYIIRVNSCDVDICDCSSTPGTIGNWKYSGTSETACAIIVRKDSTYGDGSAAVLSLNNINMANCNSVSTIYVVSGNTMNLSNVTFEGNTGTQKTPVIIRSAGTVNFGDGVVFADNNGSPINASSASTGSYSVSHAHSCEHDHTNTGDWIPLSSKLNAEGVTLLGAGRYYLDKDITLGTATGDEGKEKNTLIFNGNALLCLNGHSLSAADGRQYVIYMNNAWTLDICDCSAEETGKITGFTGSTAADTSSYSAIIVRAGSTVNLYGGTITGNSAHSIVYVVNSADGATSTFNMYGGKIVGNTTDTNGAVHVCSGAAFNMYGGEISENAVPAGLHQVTGAYINQAGTIRDSHDHTTGWTALTQNDFSSAIKKITAGGCYYLAEDVTLSGSYYLNIDTTSPVTLCLNGHTMTREATKNYYAIRFNKAAKFSLCDCSQGQTGTIDVSNTNNTLGASNAAIIDRAGGTFNLYGGNVIGGVAVASSGTAVSTFNMYGGTLKPANNVANSIYLNGTAAGYKEHLSISGGNVDGAIYQVNSNSVVTITGGKFSVKPNASYLAEGYVAIEQENTDYPYVVVACDHAEDKHTVVHSKAATCTETGLTEGKECACGKIIVAQEEVSALGHNLVDVSAQEPTYEAVGWEAYKACSRCDYTEGYVEIPKLEEEVCDHADDKLTVTKAAQDATCTDAGWTEEKTCSCGEVVVKSEPIEALGHTEVTIPAVEPTYESVGYTEGVKCSVCETVLVVPQEIPALEKPVEQYTVTVDSAITNGIVEVDKAEAAEGETITVTVTANEGYEIGEVKANDEVLAGENGVYTFTVTADTTVTATFEKEVVALTGSIRLRSAALNLLDKVSIIYRCSDDLVETKPEDVAERGVMLFDSAEKAATKNIKDATEIVLVEWNETEEIYKGFTEGIDARDMDVSRFAVAYLKLVDGTYIYGSKNGVAQDPIEYSPRIYCANKKNDATMGKLCRALMYYGAAAQVTQYGMTTGLMSEGFEAIAYDAAVLGETVFSADTAVTNGMKLRSGALDLAGAISYIVRYTKEDTALADTQLYAEYTLLGKTGSVELEYEASKGQYKATISGIPAKDMGATLRVKPYYLNENGEKVYGGELVYSGYEYARRTVAGNGAQKDKDLAMALAMYIHYADAYGNG